MSIGRLTPVTIAQESWPSMSPLIWLNGVPPPQINEEEHLLLVLEGSDCFLDLSTEVVGPHVGSSETTATDG